MSAVPEEPLSANVTVLHHGGRTIHLVGTAHVSQASVDEVRDVIARVRPDTVCVELCESRHAALVDESRWKKLDVFKVIREGKTLFLLANLAIGAYQRRLGDELGVRPGAELLAAVEAAHAVGAEVVLADRDIHVTLKRTWANLGFWKKNALLGAVLGSFFTRRDEVDARTVEELKDKAHLSAMMAEFARAMPEVKGPLIDERDLYLISAVREAKGERVVAVVGAGHVAGMARAVDTPVDREALSQLPPKSRWVGALQWLIPALLVAAFAVGLSKPEAQSLGELVWAWVLPTGGLSAAFTLLVGASFAAVAAAAIAAPITTLHPLIGAGMVVGLVEAWRRRPTVEDCENLHRDVQSLRGFFRNPVTRVLIVAVASSLGAALGAWVGLGWVLTLVS